MRQTEATGYISHLFHLVLATHCHSYQSILKPHRLTLLFAAGLGAGQPGRPALLGDPPQTADTTASRCAKDGLCLSAMALCSLGASLTPQSTLSLPGFLTGFLLQVCLKIICYESFFLYELLLKKICFDQSYGLVFVSIQIFFPEFILSPLLQQRWKGFMFWNYVGWNQEKGETEPIRNVPGTPKQEWMLSHALSRQNNLPCVGLMHQHIPSKRGILSSQAEIVAAVTPMGHGQGLSP